MTMRICVPLGRCDLLATEFHANTHPGKGIATERGRGRLYRAPADRYDGAKLNRCDGPPVLFNLRTIQAAGAVLLMLVAGCAPMPAPSGVEDGRYLVYFNELSASLSPDALNVIATASQRAKEVGARTVLVQGRASATGSPAANQHLTETRTQAVYDALQKDGVNPSSIQQQPLGQATTTDTTVMDRRVDIVLFK
jgi:outer membrane protein OmpA-like peptidoglycan-associated protein